MSLESAARAYAASHMGSTDGIADSAIREFVGAVYPGGWSAFVTNNRQSIEASTDSPPISRTMAHALREIRDTFGVSPQVMHLRPYEEWMEAHISETSAFLVKRIVRFEERSRRDIITATGTEIISWVKSEDGDWVCVPKVISWDDEPELPEQIKWGRVRDQRRVADDEWQQRECFRPGTHKTPMNGPIHEAGMSHADVFGKVVPVRKNA